MTDTVPILIDGFYSPSKTPYISIKVSGETISLKSNTGSINTRNIKYGNFGKASEAIVKASKIDNFNMVIVGTEDKREIRGVVTENGTKILMEGDNAIFIANWITEEEAVKTEEEGDPIDMPPGPYTLQPHKAGKLLWISGSPGIGKSTTAQYLGRTKGFVYYETDCFFSLKNPYIPLDVENPTLMQAMQRPLKGEGLETRRDICQKAVKAFMKFMAGEEPVSNLTSDYFEMLGKDIYKERKRIGGDWAVAGVAVNREMRDLMRVTLGEDLLFVMLTMEEESIKKRLLNRHKQQEMIVNRLMKVNKMIEDVAEEEPQVVKVNVTEQMSHQDVAQEILRAASLE